MRDREGRSYRNLHDDREPTRDTVTPSKVQQLQRLGNSRLLQLRGGGIEQPGAPDWIRDQLGIHAAEETNFTRVTEAREAAEQAAAGVTLPSGGTALEAPVREHAEQHLGTPLDDVRVIHGADSACASMGAMAFASGSDVYLSSSVDTGTQDGQFTVMHELAHVVQQKRGATSGLEGLGGDSDKRESLEREADALASKMLR